MIRILIFFLVLSIGLVFLPRIAGKQGAVFIEFGEYNIETSIPILVIIFVLLLFFCFFIFYLFQKLLKISEKTGYYFQQKRANNLEKIQRKAQLTMLEGNYNQAEKLLQISVKKANDKSLIYLQAINVALQNNELNEALNLLKESAKFQTKETELAFQILQIRYLLKKNQIDEAVDLIKNLLNSHSKNPELLKFAAKTFLQTNNEENLLKLLPNLKKSNQFNNEELQQIEQKIYKKLIEINSKNGSKELLIWWKKQSKNIRLNEELENQLYCKLLEFDEDQLVLKRIFSRAKREFLPKLIAILSKIKVNDYKKIDIFLNRWEEKKDELTIENQIILMRTIANIEMQNENWNKAKEYILWVIEHEPTIDDYILLEKINAKTVNFPLAIEKK